MPLVVTSFCTDCRPRVVPEPERVGHALARHPSAVVVELVKIRTLADAWVPLSRVRELLVADDAELARTVAEIDHRLQAEIRERQEHRRRIARLAAGDSLALPPEAVAYLDRLRALRCRERIVEIERHSWILVAAQMPKVAEEITAFARAPDQRRAGRLLDAMFLEFSSQRPAPSAQRPAPSACSSCSRSAARRLDEHPTRRPNPLTRHEQRPDQTARGLAVGHAW
ncbi:MAG: hypothetical protein ACRCSN_12550 [Dermatophilaceae bacterium]